jgi:hypothetical protein
MSIDDIIRHIDEDCTHRYEDDADYALVELQYIPKIVALLKAGQAMRASLQRIIEHPANNIVAYGSADSWDLATREEDEK